jgi:3-hydroxybutyryl-CoA dehydrogenase
MGAGIAEVASLAGIDVVARELPEYLDGARQRLEGSLGRAVKRGKLDAAGRDAALARIIMTSDLKDVAGAELVVEAVPENVELKTSIMKTLGGVVADEAIIASNTSSIPIAQVASAVHNPDRVVGLHFFSPVPVMGLVEVVRALDTSQRRDDREGSHVHRTARQAGHRDEGSLRLHRQHAVGGVSDGRGANVRGGFRHP